MRRPATRREDAGKGSGSECAETQAGPAPDHKHNKVHQNSPRQRSSPTLGENHNHAKKVANVTEPGLPDAAADRSPRAPAKKRKHGSARARPRPGSEATRRRARAANVQNRTKANEKATSRIPAPTVYRRVKNKNRGRTPNGQRKPGNDQGTTYRKQARDESTKKARNNACKNQISILISAERTSNQKHGTNGNREKTKNQQHNLPKPNKATCFMRRQQVVVVATSRGEVTKVLELYPAPCRVIADGC
ncbi:unnamed protein product [Gadus morhua 'NCC']